VLLWALSGALIRPALGALVSEAAPPAQRGTILSVNDSLNNVAFASSPFVSTAVLTFNPHLTGVVPTVFACIALAIGYRIFVAPRKDEPAEAAA
jgi:MFS family permease